MKDAKKTLEEKAEGALLEYILTPFGIAVLGETRDRLGLASPEIVEVLESFYGNGEKPEKEQQ